MNLTGALQENVLTLLCFDERGAPIIATSVDVDLFESAVYRNIARAAAGYVRKYKKPAGNHLPDLLEDLISEDKKGVLYKRTLHDLKELSETINAEYVLSELGKFIRKQSLRKSITEAAAHVQADDLDKAEKTINEGMRIRLSHFEPGMRVGDKKHLADLDEERVEVIATGIRALDKEGICPARKEVFTIVAPRNRGKTWGLVQIGRMASLQNLKVAHITLEMSEPKMYGRYIQNFFALTRREVNEIRVPKFVFGMDKKKRTLRSIGLKLLEKRGTLSNPIVRKKIGERMEEMGGRMNVMVKQFPTGKLTIDALNTYLEMLPNIDGFQPDMVILDYPELMSLPIKDYRLAIGQLFREFRGIMVERNQAGVTASQSNRGGEKAKIITMGDMAEDISKADTSDNIITYNQTAQEKPHGLARLFVAKGRNERSGQVVLISQSYAMGQFCLDSHLMTKSYWPLMERLSRKQEALEEEAEDD